MTPANILRVGYWVDVLVKGAIGIALSVATWHMKRINDDIEGLKAQNVEKAVRIIAIETTQAYTVKNLEKIDSKIDRLLMEKRR